jgi:hypothetical protein
LAQSDWSTFLISNGLSDLPYLYSIMLHLAELGLGATNNFDSVKKLISHLKAAIGCLVEVTLTATGEFKLGQGILKGEVALYH